MNIRRYELLSLEHPRRTLRLARAVGTAKRVATDQAVHREAQRAIVSASHAARRAQRVGLGNALTDRRATRHLRHATVHASSAANLALHPHRVRARKTVIVVIGAGQPRGPPTTAGGGSPSRRPSPRSYTGSNPSLRLPVQKTASKRSKALLDREVVGRARRVGSARLDLVDQDVYVPFAASPGALSPGNRRA